MKVYELTDLLSRQDPDAEVYFVGNYYPIWSNYQHEKESIRVGLEECKVKVSEGELLFDMT